MATLEANLILDHVRQYLGKHSYSKDGAFLSFQGYIAMMVDASQILNDARASVNEVDAEPVFPGVDVIVVDADTLRASIKSMMFKVLVASVEDENVQAILPFQTSLRKGNRFTHIVNASFYTMKNVHSIEPGDAICGRGGSFDSQAAYRIHTTPVSLHIDQHTVPTCPGCLAKSKHIIVEHLLAKCDGDPVCVAKMLADRQ
jgi:hypothetical protein